MNIHEQRRKDLVDIAAMICRHAKPERFCCGCGQALSAGVKGSQAVTSYRDICFDCKFGDEP